MGNPFGKGKVNSFVNKHIAPAKKLLKGDVEGAVVGQVKNAIDPLGIQKGLLDKAGIDVNDPLKGLKPKKHVVNEGAFDPAKLDKAKKLLHSQQRKGTRYNTVRGATIDKGPQDQMRGGQNQLIGQLQDQAAGKGPSLAGAQMKQGMEQGLKQQMAAMAAGGTNPALAQRQASMAGAENTQNIANQAGQMRMQEQMNAQGALGNVLQGARTQDIGLATDQAGLVQDADIANQGARMDATRLTDANNLGFAGLENTLTRDQFGAGQELESIKADAAVGHEKARQQHNKGMMDAGGSIISGLVASDRALKENIEGAGPKLENLMDRMKGYSYDYKDPRHGEGEHIGPMAQDLEKSAIGRSMVEDTPEGKMVDYNQPSTFMAMAAHLNDKLDSLESRLAGSAERKKKKGAK